MNKTLKLVAFGLLALIATANMQAMQSAQPGRMARARNYVAGKLTGFRDGVKAKAAFAGQWTTDRAASAYRWADSKTPQWVRKGTDKTVRFFNHPVVYYPLTAVLALGLGYKSYSIYKDEFEFTKKAAAYAAGSAISGALFFKEPVMHAASAMSFFSRVLKK
jgi:hypothetical protein